MTHPKLTRADVSARTDPGPSEGADTVRPDTAAPLDRIEEERAAGEGMIARPAGSTTKTTSSTDTRPSGDARLDGEDLPATSDAQHATIDHERTSEPDMRRTQRGWQVHDRFGSHLGEVVERDDASFVVALAMRAAAGTRIPMQLIADEDVDARRARLTVGANELEHMRPPGDEERPPDHP